MLRDVAAKQRHVEGSPTFLNASFRYVKLRIAEYSVEA